MAKENIKHISTNIKEFLMITSLTHSDLLVMQMEINIKAIFKKEKNKEKEYTLGQMVHIMKDHTKMI